MDDIALVTPTSDRPLAFDLCERWMARALSYFGRAVHWYVVDDGMEAARCHMGQTQIRRPPCESPIDSFLGNLAVALNCVREQKILFIEDDDWYAPDYIAVYAEWLEQAEIVGEAGARYYSLPSRRYTIFPNTEHASLCQTGIRKSLMGWFLNHVAQTRAPFVDIPLWKEGATTGMRRLDAETRRCVGIKGLPGKMGISEGHDGRPDWEGEDADGDVLRSWIGQEDADVYLNLQFPVSVAAQH